MPYTTHGYMTPADLADHHALHDTGPHPDCPGHEDADGPYTCSVNDECPRESRECTCAMTEASMVNCEVHGYDAPARPQ